MSWVIIPMLISKGLIQILTQDLRYGTELVLLLCLHVVNSVFAKIRGTECHRINVLRLTIANLNSL